jgi:hypothetical protein
MQMAVLAVGGLLALPVAAQASDRLLATLNACKAVPEAAARLACYDAALGRAAATPASAPAPAAAPVAPVAPAAPAPVAAAAAPPVAAPGPTRADDFGLNQPRPETVLQQIESRVVGRFEGWAPGTRIELANGQVWEVVDGSRAAYDMASPAVRIKRGMLGSFFLEIEGVSATPRVRRLK